MLLRISRSFMLSVIPVTGGYCAVLDTSHKVFSALPALKLPVASYLYIHLLRSCYQLGYRAFLGIRLPATLIGQCYQFRALLNISTAEVTSSSKDFLILKYQSVNCIFHLLDDWANIIWIMSRNYRILQIWEFLQIFQAWPLALFWTV
jgi:hypothetical protein